MPNLDNEKAASAIETAYPKTHTEDTITTYTEQEKTDRTDQTDMAWLCRSGRINFTGHAGCP